MAGPGAGKIEAAFGADLTADPLTWTYTDLTPRNQVSPLRITWGRRNDGTRFAEPATTMVLLENDNGDFTARKASSIYYPNVRRGLPVRAYWNFGARYLSVTGAASGRAGTPDAASLDVTDLAGAVQFRCPVRCPAPGGTAFEVVGKNVNSGNQRSWLFYLPNDGRAELRWSPDGTNEISSRMTRPFPRPDAGPLTVGWELDVDNGASGNTTTWYVIKGTIAELLAALSASTFGDPWINSGTTSIFNSTAPLEIGDVVGAGFLPYRGGIDAVLIRNGTLSGGTIAANPNFAIQTVGAGSFADTAAVPKTWTITSPAAITDRKQRLVGQLHKNTPLFPGQGAEGSAQARWDIVGVLHRLRKDDEPLESALYRTVTAPANTSLVKAFWPMHDGRDATAFASPIPGVQPMIFGGDLQLAANDDYAASKARPTVAGGRPAGWNGSVPPYSGTNHRVDTYYNIPTADASPTFTPLMYVSASGTVARWSVEINDTDLRVIGIDSAGTNVFSSTSSGGMDLIHGVDAVASLHFTQSGGNVAWDVSLVDTASGVTVSASSTFAGTVGIVTAVADLFGAAPPDGFTVGPIVVSVGTALGWLAGGDSAFFREPAPSRVFRLCREQGIPILIDGPYGAQGDWEEAIAAGAQPMGHQRPDKLLDLLEECAATDEGLLSESRELLGLAYRSGASLINQTSVITLGNEITELSPTDDTQGLVNDGTVTRANGSFSRYVNTTHKTAEGHFKLSKETNPAGDGQLPHLASWWVNWSTWPEMRVSEFRAELAKNSALYDDWFDANIGDKVSLTGLPDELETSTLDQLLAGWTETLSPHIWSLTINGDKAGPWTVGTLDDNTPTTTLARLDSNTSTLNEALTTTETDVDVAFTGVRWTTTGAQFPFDIMIGGEQMTVTAIAGTTSPQTFTVTRSINGVVKSHSSGGAVNVFYPIRLTL